MAERTCTPEHHVFDGPDGGGKRLNEGDSATCQCGNIVTTLRNGKIETTVDITAIDGAMDEQIKQALSVPADCGMSLCTFPGQHNHGTD